MTAEEIKEMIGKEAEKKFPISYKVISGFEYDVNFDVRDAYLAGRQVGAEENELLRGCLKNGKPLIQELAPVLILQSYI